MVNNTGALDVHPFKQRQADAAWFNYAKEQSAFLLGCGGINSNVAMLLASTEVELYIYDDDVVGAENMNAQHFPISTIGFPKVAAIKDSLLMYLGVTTPNIVSIEDRYNETSMSNNIVFMGFDNMSARKAGFDNWVKLVNKHENPSDCILLDGRLLAEKYQIFCVTPDKIEEYRATLFDDSEVAEVDCTLKATRFASWGIASDIVACFLNWCTNKALGDSYREVPFKIEKSYDAFYYSVQ